ncbi:MAG: hypothetical protein R6V44_03795 [Paracoccaceae bacterium]
MTELSPKPMPARVRREDLPPRLAEMRDAARCERDEAVLIEVAGNAPEVIERCCDRVHGETVREGRVEPPPRQKLSTPQGRAFRDRGAETAVRIAARGGVEAGVFDARRRGAPKLRGETTLSNRAGRLSRAPPAEFRAAGSGDGEVFEPVMVAAVSTGMAKFPSRFDVASREAVRPIAPPAAG